MHISLLIALTGCTPEGPGYSGYDMVDHFPLDGSERSWLYTNSAEEHKIFVEMAAERIEEDVVVKTLEYWQTDPNNNQPSTLLYSIDWASDPIAGVRIYGYTFFSDPVQENDTGDSGDNADTSYSSTEEEGDESNTVAFDPPIQLGDRRMIPGESIVTETGGATWTATFESTAACANDWVGGENTWTCLHIVLDDGDGDMSAGSPISGEFWTAPRYGLSWFQLTGDADQWILATAKWEE
jgi:hypothetical protein